MSITWTSYVYENLKRLTASTSPDARALVALYELKLDHESGGLTAYLMNSSGNHFYEVKTAFEQAGFTEGLNWVSNVEKRYGKKLPSKREARIDAISSMPGFDDEIDPFDAEHRQLDILLPQIDRLAVEVAKRDGAPGDLTG